MKIQKERQLCSFDLSISKDFKFDKHTLTFGANIFNIFDEPYAIDIYELTGTADSPGEYYDDFVGKEVSGSYYDPGCILIIEK